MKLVEIIKFQTEEIFQIESPTQALIALNQLTPRELASIPKIASYKERWMTIPADLEYQIKNGMVFLVRNSVNDVVLPAVTYDKDNILKDQVFDDTTDLVHESLRINSSLPTAFKMGLKFLIKDKPTPLSARIYEANVGNSGDEQSSISSINQSEDKDVKYNEGLSKQDEKNKDSQKNDSNNQESKEKAPATKTEEEKPKDEQEKKCETCGKAYDAECPGSNKKAKRIEGYEVGKGTKLGEYIAENWGFGDDINKHPWNYEIGRTSDDKPIPSLQAHHLIDSNTLRSSSKIRNVAQKFGYNINSKDNGVMLPSAMELACHLEIPLHKGSHDATYTDVKSNTNTEVFLPYPQAVAQNVIDIIVEIEESGKCILESGNKFIEEMNELSEIILGNISSFTWTISSDGIDYKSNGTGCGNPNASETEINSRRGIPDKRKDKGKMCALRETNEKHIFPKEEINEISNVTLEIGK
ncbi:AHH domain-containing protein [Marinicellulosiphila megalodicopiae]|uniref:AHH domain-containing protein n=1 Tax=Marinicellulosiphila megalodicopiae TaxID=2724896 RepID=UPI003BB0BBA5